MKLIQSLSALLAQGVQIKMMLQANGDQIQLDILPAGKENKAGIILPAKSLTGTAAELDANLEAFMEKYSQSVAKISSIIAASDADLEQAEKEAQDQAKAALEEKRAKSPAKPATKPTAGTKPGAKPARNLDAGLSDPDDDTEVDGQNGTGNEGTPVGAAGAPAATGEGTGPDNQSNALTSDLFNV
jgi:PRTRC genetic system protein E